MFKKFEGPLWYTYMEWPNVIDAIANCTVSTSTADRWGGRDRRCWDQLNCAFTAADASQQARYSSAATIFGLVRLYSYSSSHLITLLGQLPTVLAMMATSTADLLYIHHRYPVVALLLSLCNPSTIASGLASDLPFGRSLSSSEKILNSHERILLARRRLRSTRSTGYRPMISFLTVRLHISDAQIDFLHDLILHLYAAGVAGTMLWQAILLGMRGVIVFACWTWHQPFTWIGVSGILHLLAAITWRFCLGPLDPTLPFSRCHWSLSRSGSNLTLTHPRVARFMEIVFQILGLMNYGYGTVMLSGTTLVSPRNSLVVFCLMGYASVCSRLAAIWLLEVFPDVPNDREEERGMQIVEVGRERGMGLVGNSVKEDRLVQK
jgi:hypothetical protein